MDYRDLLLKYIKHVKVFAGDTYLQSDRVEMNNTISQNEFVELKQLEQE